jgi:hypothetical protein
MRRLGAIICGTLFLMLFAREVFCQRSLEEIPESQRIALHKLITKKPQYDFVSETLFGEDILKDIRTKYWDYFGRKFRPYYKTGDFNRDRKQDFAMILIDNSAPEPENPTDELAEYGFVVAIFNGDGRGGYRLAHTEKVKAPKQCLIHVAPKSTSLYFGVWETDAYCTNFVPAGKGYLAEYCGL